MTDEGHALARFDDDDFPRGDPAERIAATATPGASLAHFVAGLLPDWHLEAECNGVPIEVFFPNQYGSNRHALELCGMCSVRERCLTEALADPDLDHGVRGGMSAQARKQRRKSMQRAFGDAS